MKTQQSNPPAKDGICWLVTPPEGVTFTAALTAACRGNEKLANILNYFLDVAAREAKRQNIDIEKVDYIEIKRLQDNIVAGLERHNKGASKKTIRDRMVILTSLSYLDMDAYHNTYRIYFRNIQSGMHNPPESEKPKLRGRHVKRLQNACQDGNFNLKVKSTISAQDGNFNFQEEMVILRRQMLDLTSQMSNLTFEKSNLTSQMSNLTFVVSQQAARIAELEAQLASLYNSNTVIDTVGNTVGTYGTTVPVVENDASIPATSITEIELPPLEATEEIAEPVQPPPSPEPTKPERPAGKRNRNVTVKETPPEPQQQKLEMPALDAVQQAVYDEWCKMPWFHGVAPKITPAMPDTLKKLAAYSLTADQMLEVKKWATSAKVDRTGYYKNKGWSIFFLANEVPKWLSAQPEKPAETKQPKPEPASPDMLVLWTRNPSSPKFSMDASAWYFYEEMTLEEARQYDYDLYGGLPGDIQMRIKTQFDREQRGEIKRPELVA